MIKSRLILFMLTYIFYGSIVLGSNENIFKVKGLQAKVQLAQIEMRTIDKNIRNYQEESLEIQSKIENTLNQIHKFETQNPKAFVDSQLLDEELVLTELSLLDEESLESIGEQEVILESLHQTFQEKSQKSLKTKVIGRKLSHAQDQLRSLYNIQKQSQRLLIYNQRKKVLLSASIEDYKTKILSYEDFSLVEKAIENARKIAPDVRDNLGSKFESPIKDYASYRSEENGLRFKCYSQCLLSAPATGYVIHSGELVPYGRILILSHGQNLRSVFLGEFNAKVKKGAKVYRGDRIGATYAQSLGNIYFELRKNNQPIDILKKIPTI